MVIGDTVIHDGREWTVIGFTPVSVTPAELELESPEGERLWVERASVGEPVERAALRLVSEPGRDD